MPFTFNGIGTINYGARDFRPDGSYVTTEWVVVAYVPIAPLRSRRIRPAGQGVYFVVYGSSNHYILEETGINGRQVLSIYGWCSSLIASIALAAQFDAWPLAVLGVLILPLPWLLRKRAVRQMLKEYERTRIGLSPTDIG